VSRNALVAKQIPYVVSGGIFGIALVGVGAVLIGTEGIRKSMGRIERLEKMVAELHGALLAPDDSLNWAGPAGDLPTGEVPEVDSFAPVSNGQGSVPAPVGPTDDLLALPSGQSYHRAGCAMVEGKDQVIRVTAATIGRRGLAPCRLCEPAVVGA
jgi:hypothetical protein